MALIGNELVKITGISPAGGPSSVEKQATTQDIANLSSGGTPGGSTTQVQYNNAGAFAGITGATSNGTILTLVAPVLGAASATSINKVAITAPATSATLAIANTKTLTVSNTLTLTGTDTSSVAFGAGGTVAYLTANTFTQTQTITPAADTEALTISGGSVTGSGISSFASIAGTWNTSGIALGVKINITNTASHASSDLLSVGSGGGSYAPVFQVRATGGIQIDNSFILNTLAPDADFGAGLKFGVGAIVVLKREKNVTGNINLSLPSNIPLVLGAGDWTATPSDGLLYAPWASGSNIAGKNLILGSGVATGNAATGSILLKTTTVGSSGTTSQSYTTRLTISTAGVIAAVPVRLPGYTVATLPAGTVGDNAYVTDALAPTFLATVSGGGAIVTPVFYNGSAWVGA